MPEHSLDDGLELIEDNFSSNSIARCEVLRDDHHNGTGVRRQNIVDIDFSTYNQIIEPDLNEFERQLEIDRINRQQIENLQNNLLEYFRRPTQKCRMKLKSTSRKSCEMKVPNNADFYDPSQSVGRKVIIKIVKLKEPEKAKVIESKISKDCKCDSESEWSDTESIF
ncbi:uncharacterized protein LOC119683659 [Teleopsis dalmanni]|uniref:uncharacterized protein LOC119683659 n=1 Tax=Teleopsis dalmanni TaxID=139649 RepID=UPI0018CE563E|nr:uncharacterized protein LOC119683659 [Teleopsis dalmanni]